MTATPWYVINLECSEVAIFVSVQNRIAQRIHLEIAEDVLVIELGEWEDALNIHRAALGARRRLLGNDHPDTLVSINNVAVAYH